MGNIRLKGNKVKKKLPLIKVGKYYISEKELLAMIVDKIPKSQFSSIIQKIKKDLEKDDWPKPK